MNIEKIKEALSQCTREERHAVFRQLRGEFVIHKLEEDLRIPAEIILEAIDRAPDLTKRGVRGIIAEAVFVRDVLPAAVATGWTDTTPPNTENPAYDARLSHDGLDVRIQVKTQRLVRGQPWLRDFPRLGKSYVVETQRTRGGKSSAGGDTRPYRADEFDLLAVCMFPSTGDWREFRYAATKDLIRRPGDKSLLAVLQPVPVASRRDRSWTDDLISKLSDLRQR